MLFLYLNIRERTVPIGHSENTLWIFDISKSLHGRGVGRILYVNCVAGCFSGLADEIVFGGIGRDSV